MAAMTSPVSAVGSGGSGRTTRTSLTVSSDERRLAAEHVGGREEAAPGRTAAPRCARRRGGAPGRGAVVGAAWRPRAERAGRARRVLPAPVGARADAAARRSQSWRTRSRVMPPNSRPVASSVAPPRPSQPQWRTAICAVRPGSACSAIAASSASSGRSDSSTGSPLRAARWRRIHQAPGWYDVARWAASGSLPQRVRLHYDVADREARVRGELDGRQGEGQEEGRRCREDADRSRT